MTIDTDNVGSIATTLKEAGVSAVARNRIMSDIKAAIANAAEDRHSHSHTPLGDHLTAAQDAELTYAARLALASARRVGVVVDPTKGISLEDFDRQARGEATARIVAKSQLHSLKLLRA
jgi:hypothetical protein